MIINSVSQLMDVGPIIAEQRKKRGIRACDLADQAGISKCNLSMIEHGKRLVSLELANKLLEPLGLKVEQEFLIRMLPAKHGRDRNAS